MYFGGGKVEILVESLIKHAPSEHVARSAPPRGAGEGGEGRDSSSGMLHIVTALLFYYVVLI